MKFEIFGEQTVTDTFEISMNPCTDYSMFNLGEDNSRNPRSEAFIQAHIDAKQFYCPDSFDLTMYGMKGDLQSKIVSIGLIAQDREVL